MAASVRETRDVYKHNLLKTLKLEAEQLPS